MSQQITKIDRNENYGQKIYQQLKMLIINGTLKAGGAINEREYSAMLGISRTPLRDALNMLEQEGWIEQNGKMRMISVLRWRDMLELMELRSPMGHLSLDLAFPKYLPSDLDHMDAILQEMSRFSMEHPGDFYTVMNLDTEFHSYLTSITRNEMLIKMDIEMNEKLCRSNCLSMWLSKLDGGFHAREHFQLMDCLRKKDLTGAHNALEKHFQVWEKRVRKLPEVMGFSPADMDAGISEKFSE